jgi:hypothetical protein
MISSKISQLERHFSETQASTTNVSAFRDTFITGALEYLAYFLRYSIWLTGLASKMRSQLRELRTCFIQVVGAFSLSSHLRGQHS